MVVRGTVESVLITSRECISRECISIYSVLGRSRASGASSRASASFRASGIVLGPVV